MANKQKKTRVPASKVAEGVWHFILGYYSDNGYFPTCDEIAVHFTNPVTRVRYTKEWARLCLKELASQGRIQIEPRKHRGITLT